MVTFLLALICFNFVLLFVIAYLLYEKMYRWHHQQCQKIDKAFSEVHLVKDELTNSKSQIYDALFGTYDILQREIQDKIEGVNER